MRAETPSSATFSTTPFPLPSSLQLLSAPRLLLCVEHGCCYPINSVDRHLRQRHALPHTTRKPILQHLRDEGVADSHDAVVAYPRDGTPIICGLPIHQGYRCRTQGCTFKTICRKEMQRHCSKVHGQRPSRPQPKRQSQEPSTTPSPSYWQAVQLQTLWTETRRIRYFIVVNPSTAAAVQEGRERAGLGSGLGDDGGREARGGTGSHPDLSAEPPRMLDALERRFREAQIELAQGYRSLAKVEHKSEVAPWLRKTGYHAHLAQVDLAGLPDAYSLPAANGADEVWLHIICHHARLVLKRAMRLLVVDGGIRRRGPRLNRLNAKLLNTFRRGDMSQDPIEPLQEVQSQNKYINTWLQLICYFYRVREGRLLPREMFVPTPEQVHWADLLRAVGERLSSPLPDSEEEDAAAGDGEDEGGEVGEEDGGGVGALALAPAARRAVMNGTLELSLSLLRQRLPHTPFDSAMISFTAALAWDPRQGTWRPANTVSSYLAQLTYCCQILIFQHCVRECEGEDGGEDGLLLRQTLEHERDQWLLNDCLGPLAEVHASRLLAASVAQNTVNQAQVRWHQDGETLVYNDLTLRLADLPRLIREALQVARTVLRQDLCFGLPRVPTYSAEDLVDNWDSVQPGASFVTDPRNHSRLAEGQHWLFRQICNLPALASLVMGGTPDGIGTAGHGRVRSDFAKQYEYSTQRFLAHLLVLMHVGSGQAARRPEFLGIRWCNNAKAKRNLFLHDGQVLFILTYHKALNRTSASRWPVRFLLPAVGELLLQYLVLVLPLRVWLAKETQIPREISSYLWFSGESIWSPDKMTDLLKAHTRASIGVGINVQSWRQLSAGIAIKKFAGMNCQLDLDLPTEEEVGGAEGVAGADGALTRDVFHFQAGHTPRTGNQMYGGSVNFQQGLTDAGLQEYRWASQLWHRLCLGEGLPGSGKRRRQPSTASGDDAAASASQAMSTSTSTGMSLLERLTCREAPLPQRQRRQQRRRQRRWTLAEAEEGLRSFYGDGATFRGERQRTAMEVVLSGVPEVVVVLGTGEGKSLLYLLPCRLPGAGTTVVILPLVALRQDMQRRCDAAGMPYHVWHGESAEDKRLCGGGGGGEYLESPLGSGHTLIFVSVEAAVRQPFQKFLHVLNAGEALDRIVFDECHLALTSASYRQDMLDLRHLRSLRAQFVFLSATLPPSMMEAFGAQLLLKDPHVVRGRTLRTDLRHSVLRRPPGPLAQSARLIRTLWRDCSLRHAFVDASTSPSTSPTRRCRGGSGDGSHQSRETATRTDETARCIIYTVTRPEADSLARELNCPRYYSDSGDEAEKAAVLKAWLAGDSVASRMLVATSAFGLGVDYPSVRLVLHYGAPRSAIDFAQECGRGGRDGAGARSVVLLPANASVAQVSEVSEALPAAVAAMRDFLAEERCRLLPLGRFLDGPEAPVQQCGERGTACDCCCRRQSTVAVKHTKHAKKLHGPSSLTEETAPIDMPLRPESPVEGLVVEEEEEEEEWEREEVAWEELTWEGPKLRPTSTAHQPVPQRQRSQQSEMEAESEFESKSKSESERSSSQESLNLEGGGFRLQSRIQKEERGLQGYQHRLEALHGVCMICRVRQWGMLLGWTLEFDPEGLLDELAPSAAHPLEKCPVRRRFTDCKKVVMSRASRGGLHLPSGAWRHKGWLAPFAACYSCGNPQAVCPPTRQGACEHRDIVMPACWAAYQLPQWRRQCLPAIAASVGRRTDFADETDYMLWLGERVQWNDVPASVMAPVADQIMHTILSPTSQGGG